MKTKFLILGSGSIGRRHMRNLRGLGAAQLAAFDPDPTRLQPMIDELGATPYSDYARALDEFRPDAVFVCSPPAFHISQAAQAIQHNAHVFIEKPLSDTLDGIDDLIALAREKNRVAQVGYMFRFHPGLQKIKALLDGNAIGKPLYARLEYAQYLPDWRPWQDYRQSYTARAELGGGIILDSSHEIDTACWLLGKVSGVTCAAAKVSSLEVNVEDCATLNLAFVDGARADVHVDFVQRGYTRTCKIAGEAGTLAWDYTTPGVQHYDAESKAWRMIETPSADMYVAETQHFLECIANNRQPLVTPEQARDVLKVALAAKRSASNLTGLADL
ncbi:MAG TPA: Gfo/Idh/MocA family oxidoreductase [Thermoflexales bacterium]|nr:Gfo/Idh/MocA family oxidoreductase [Thermoflexales bacterium]